MGEPKLLMPLAGRPLIAHAIEAWRQSGVDRIFVVVRADDEPLATTVQAVAIDNLELVRPREPPPDMKASVQAALRHIERQHAPAVDDCFLVAPADMPRLSPAIIRAVLAERICQPGQIVVPAARGRRGHPVLFPWSLAADVQSLAENEGLNVLLDRHETVAVPCDSLAGDPERDFADIDTREEYRRLVGE
jgi:molybdenum cofactor cytidylyltransferase